MTFFPDSDQIASCTRHGFVRLIYVYIFLSSTPYLHLFIYILFIMKVRLYDPLLPQRRPVINVQQPDEVFTCLSRTPNDQ